MALGTRTRVKPPTNFLATAVSDSAINITWTLVPTAFRYGQYVLQRSSDGGSNYSNLYTGTAAAYVDTGLVANTSYLYQITFTDANGNASPTIGAGATTQPSPNSGAQQKFIAGWYAGISQTQAGTRPGDSYIGVPNAGTPGVPSSGVRSNVGPICNKLAGCQIRMSLRLLNPTGTTYDFTPIATALAQLATFPIDANNPNPLLLFIRVETRTFNNNTANSDNPLPADLCTAAQGGTGTRQLSEIYTGSNQVGIQAYRWSPAFLARLDTVAQKIGQLYDTHPNFGGLGTQETATGGTNGVNNATYSATAADGTVYTGNDFYSPNNFAAGLKAESNIYKKWLPHCRGYHYMNFIPNAVQNNPPAGELTEDGYLEDVCSTIVANGGICGFPDLQPSGAPFTRTYPTINKVHNGTLPGVQGLAANLRRGVTMGAIQPNEWANDAPAGLVMSLQERFDLATAKAGTTYGTGSPLNLDNIALEWQQTVRAPLGTQKFNPDGAAIVAANPSFGNYTPPSPNPTYLYIDLNAVTNGSGASANVPTNILPTQIIADNTIWLFNADNGIQYLPTRTDTILVNANTITIGSYGTGKAVLAALDTFTSGWTAVSGTVYKRTYTPAAGGNVGAAINMSDTTGSAQGTVLKWTDLTTPASFVPSSLPVGYYAYDYTAGVTVMYVNVGANANTKTIGIARNGRFINVPTGGAPTTAEIKSLRLIGFSRAAVNVAHEASGWRVHDCEFYANGAYWTGGASPNYEGSGVQVAHNATNIEIYNNLIEETFDSPTTVQHFGGSTGEAISNVHIHHNTIRKWALGACEIADFGTGGTNSTTNIEVNHNIMTGGGQGFSSIGSAPLGVTDGVQIRGANGKVTGLNVHDNTIQAFDANIACRSGATPGGIQVTNNRLSSAKYGIRNLQAAIGVTAVGNQFCAHSINDVNDVNGTPTTTSLNGGNYSTNTTQAGQCYTPDLSTQGRQ